MEGGWETRFLYRETFGSSQNPSMHLHAMGLPVIAPSCGLSKLMAIQPAPLVIQSAGFLVGLLLGGRAFSLAGGLAGWFSGQAAVWSAGYTIQKANYLANGLSTLLDVHERIPMHGCPCTDIHPCISMYGSLSMDIHELISAHGYP